MTNPLLPRHKCKWCQKEFDQPEKLQRHLVKCKKSPGRTGKRKASRGER